VGRGQHIHGADTASTLRPIHGAARHSIWQLSVFTPERKRSYQLCLKAISSRQEGSPGPKGRKRTPPCSQGDGEPRRCDESPQAGGAEEVVVGEAEVDRVWAVETGHSVGEPDAIANTDRLSGELPAKSPIVRFRSQSCREGHGTRGRADEGGVGACQRVHLELAPLSCWRSVSTSSISAQSSAERGEACQARRLTTTARTLLPMPII
jgi:hypothetical protein